MNRPYKKRVISINNNLDSPDVIMAESSPFPSRPHIISPVDGSRCVVAHSIDDGGVREVLGQDVHGFIYSHQVGVVVLKPHVVRRKISRQIPENTYVLYALGNKLMNESL